MFHFDKKESIVYYEITKAESNVHFGYIRENAYDVAVEM